MLLFIYLSNYLFIYLFYLSIKVLQHRVSEEGLGGKRSVAIYISIDLSIYRYIYLSRYCSTECLKRDWVDHKKWCANAGKVVKEDRKARKADKKKKDAFDMDAVD